MSIVYYHHSKRQPPCALGDNSLSCAEHHSVTLTKGGSYLFRHKNVRPAIADVVAELAGIGKERCS
jgi:hypothetical protein